MKVFPQGYGETFVYELYKVQNAFEPYNLYRLCSAAVEYALTNRFSSLTPHKTCYKSGSLNAYYPWKTLLNSYSKEAISKLKPSAQEECLSACDRRDLMLCIEECNTPSAFKKFPTTADCEKWCHNENSRAIH
ncbi:unnamed protein product [Cylicocyclus nassatus]|uniref:Uncharacterized protein n=1 Tax=Cylicocyclus nassatus TaxID=53992 RepID=A0AA36GWB3_CYLNA|nr:unnamed protein product [Cylicocyclus nassatus]